MSEPIILNIEPVEVGARQLIDEWDAPPRPGRPPVDPAAYGAAMRQIALDLIDRATGLRQELDEARAERDQALALLGDAYDANGKHQAERDRMRPVVEAAEAWRASWSSAWEAQLAPGTSPIRRLLAAVDAFRSSIPDAEPAPRTTECAESQEDT